MTEAEDWEYIGTVSEGQDIRLAGLNPWEHDWVDLRREPITVPHPQYPLQRHQMKVYAIATPTGLVTFAAGEVSNSVYGFYLPAP